MSRKLGMAADQYFVFVEVKQHFFSFENALLSEISKSFIELCQKAIRASYVSFI